MFVSPTYSTFLFSEHLIHFILFSLKRIILVLIFVALYTLAERKVMAAMQRRTGPNVVGFFGLLQPLADGVKLVIKEIIIPSKSSKTLFILAPMVTFFLSLISWAIIPFSPSVGGNLLLETPNIELGLLLVLAISSLGVYGVIIAGWASNSKYALLGALRSAAQMISYEVGIGFIIITVGLVAKSYNLATITHLQESSFFFLLLFPGCFMFLICMLAETNRAPFDLPEAEAELVAGYNIEYSGVVFAMFFLGEYSNMLLMSALISIMFFGGWVAPLIYLNFFPPFLILFFKILFFSFFFIWARASLPRYRYDQLMYIGWKILLPLSLGFLIFVICLLKSVSLGQLLPVSLFNF